MKCKCGNSLQFSDNSLNLKEEFYEDQCKEEIYPVYYCGQCDIVWDGDWLDNGGKYYSLDNKYKKWFNQ